MFVVTERDAQASADVVKDIILVSNVSARCLFNFGSTHSFVALHFVPKLGVAPKFLDVGLSISTPIGVSLDMDMVYKDCIVSVEGRL